MDHYTLRQRVIDMQREPSEVATGRAEEDVTNTSRENREDIFLFVPNLIGYARIILTVVSLYFMPVHPRRCSAIYVVSCLLDALDGWAARRSNQGTKFGAVLDMVTDRCTTTCLLVFLATAMPKWAMVFQLLISLDLASHYMHMYATLSMGESGQSHKQVDAKRSWLLHLYYTNKIVLFTLCAMNELFFVALYLLAFTEQESHVSGDRMKTVIQSEPWSAGAMEIARANKIQSSIPTALFRLSVLPMLIKQYINVQQLIVASQWLAEGDTAERARQSITE
ncbi:CDP-diacylglycerol-inositol 3-phosphatidyltransferase PIS [Aureobasidium pullulans]|uniref:CDP-diacylglycerol--inositol 3-phosphatidyltransferase n=1 Tax=Aureobasidium pullulans TaxID=5580 RepID=A0AB74IIN8_AURPU|nr:CDP-diacylglycerol-inositol 3-phosphatidyltransferase PIS [Aureobasidium pullulans]